MHAQRRLLHGMQHEREPEPAPSAVSAESEGGAVHRSARPQYRYRVAELSRHQAGGRAARRQRHQPERELHAVAVQGHSAESALQPDERGLPETGRPVVR